MSRALTALRYLAAPIVGLLAPDIVATLRSENERADAAELNEARAKGERDEARRFHADAAGMFDAIRDEHRQALDNVAAMAKRIEELEEIERNGLAADEAHTFAGQALDDLRALLRPAAGVSLYRAAWDMREDLADVVRVGWAAIIERDALRADVRRLQTDESDAVRQLRSQANALSTDLSAQRVRVRELETMLDARADVTPEPVKADTGDRCAWCKVNPRSVTYAVYENDSDGGRVEHGLCSGCGLSDLPDADMVIARVAVRAASCLARQDSADPLAKACTNCLAPVGKPCDLTAYRLE